MERLVVAWYAQLSSLTQGTVIGLQAAADAVALPVASAVLFGLIGALSPCQLTTNLGALACPECGRTEVDRVTPRSLLDRLLRLVRLRRYQCRVCGRRFFDRPLAP